MADQLRKESEKTGSYLPLEEIKNTTDKKARIESLQPMIKNGTILFSRKHRTLLEQMKFFPKGSHDDGLDALEMVINLCKKRSGGAVLCLIDWDISPDRDYRESGYYQSPIHKITIPEPNKQRLRPGY